MTKLTEEAQRALGRAEAAISKSNSEVYFHLGVAVCYELAALRTKLEVGLRDGREVIRNELKAVAVARSV